VLRQGTPPVQDGEWSMPPPFPGRKYRPIPPRFEPLLDIASTELNISHPRLGAMMIAGLPSLLENRGTESPSVDSAPMTTSPGQNHPKIRELSNPQPERRMGGNIDINRSDLAAGSHHQTHVAGGSASAEDLKRKRSPDLEKPNEMRAGNTDGSRRPAKKMRKVQHIY